MSSRLRQLLPLGPFLFALPSVAQFGTEQVIFPFVGSARMQAADLDGDGDKDLFGVFDGHQLKWFMNTDGAGAFGPAIEIGEVSGDCRQTVLADVDGDLDLDILYIADAQAEIALLRNDGTGTFLEDGAFLLPGTPETFTTADVSGDGILDLIASIPFAEGPGIAILPGTTNGLGVAASFTMLHAGNASTSIAIGDMDLVGGLDIILRGENDAIILLRNTNGDATVWTPEALPIPAGELGYVYRAPQVIDVDGDGDLDLAESRSPAIHWLRNDLNEGGALAFEENVIETWFTSGSGMFGPSPCGIGAAVVFVPANPSLPVRWNSFLPVLNDLPYSNDLNDLPRGTDLLFADLNGDAKGDLVMNTANGVVLFTNVITPSTEEIILQPIDTLCLGGPPVPLPDAIPAGGRWYGQQIDNDLLFRSNLMGTMDLPAIHAVYAQNGCPMGAAQTIRVMQQPTITTVIPAVVCSADAPFTLNAEPTNVEWFGLDGSNVVNPATWTGGYLVCQYTDATGTTCANVQGPIQRWNSLPASIAIAGPFCTDDEVQTINALAAPPFNVNWSGPVSGSTPTSTQFDPSIGAGIYEIVLSAEPFGPNQCANSDTLRVVVGEDPVIAIEPLGVYCVNGDPIALSGVTPEGGTWSGTGVSEASLDPVAAGVGTHELSYVASSAEGCSAQSTTTITLYDATQVAWTVEDLEFCPGDEPCVFTALPAGGTWDAPLSSEGVLDIAASNPGSVAVRYSYTDPRGCVLTNAEVVANIGTATAVTITPPTHICIDHAPFDLQGSAAGTWSGAVNGEGASITVDPAVLGVGTWNVTLAVVPDDACPGTASADLVVEVCAGVEELAITDARLVPNPFNEVTGVVLGRQGNARISVIDATGRVVLSRTIAGSNGTRVDLHLAGQASGVYHVQVAYDDAVQVLRAVKAE